MIPVTISCCYAFMLPVGTPCNAMVLTAGRMKPADMVKLAFKLIKFDFNHLNV